MKSIIVGAGEVGTALHNILKQHYEIFLTDRKNFKTKGIEILHIAFSYSNEFVSEVKRYQKLYEPKYTIIHSTVPIGISQQCNAYHSPIRGIHPHLEKGILTFIKYLAPKNYELKKYFEKAGIKVKLIDRPENTEALKLWSTNQYKRFIELEKEIYEWCEKRNLDFDIIYINANNTYNEGYGKLGMDYVKRPVLKHVPGKIGGHCILSNYKLLKQTKL